MKTLSTKMELARYDIAGWSRKDRATWAERHKGNGLARRLVLTPERRSRWFKT